jgi:5-methylthioadenosine/S-adenosylhomocysteine deaminase
MGIGVCGVARLSGQAAAERCSVPERQNSGSDRIRPDSGRDDRGRTGEHIGQARGCQVTSKILVRGGCVLTLGVKTPNFTRADVLIDEDVVAEVGPGLRARDAEQVDATNTIVMPGFVDTHRHAWTSLFRNLGEPVSSGEAPVLTAVGDHFQPEDVYAATLIGLLGAVEAGITTVVDWSPMRADVSLADAALQAHADAGLRSVFVHAALRRTQDHDAGPKSRQFVAHLVGAAGPSTSIAFGSVFPRSADLGRVAGEWALARELGLRIHAHVGSESSRRGAISDAAERGLLGEDVTLVHPSELDDADVTAIAASGTSVSLSPSSEMASGLGSPPIQQLVDRDIRPGLGVDDERVTPGDLFAQMRATISLQHGTVFDRKLAGKAGLPRLMSTRDVLRYATVDGARVAGVGEVVGSLEPGMQADVILLRTDRPNVFPINDPIGAVVWGMDTSNVDWVFVRGRVVMREGVLEADVERARNLATTARRRVADTSGLGVGAVSGGDA